MFYYTNFIVETNAWWLRRVRPLILGGAFIWVYYIFGKEATKANRRIT
jgi:hypothetical protein